ncbi:MAG: hypothetical protein AB7O98_06670 [Hyphomonadaceae bacterium]
MIVSADIETATSAERPRSRVVAAASVYFALVFLVGLALGPIRVLWLEPILGRTIAVLCETPFLLAAIWFAARAAPRWTKLRGGWPSLLAVGLLALAFQQLADLAVGFGLRGMTLNDQLAFFATPPGYIYAFNLIVFACAPLLARGRIAAD